MSHWFFGRAVVWKHIAAKMSQHVARRRIPCERRFRLVYLLQRFSFVSM